MAKFANGLYYPQNVSKYVGKSYPRYRSSWEKKVFQWLDLSPGVIAWGSELVKIPYQNPLTGKLSNYIPDLMIKYRDASGREHAELVEIKPIKETLVEFAKSKKDQMALAVNQSKWHQAQMWCKSKGLVFRVITEQDIFGIPKKKK